MAQLVGLPKRPKGNLMQGDLQEDEKTFSGWRGYVESCGTP